MAVRLFQNLSIVRKCSCRKEKVCKRSVGERKPKNVYAGGVVENHIPKVNETERSILKKMSKASLSCRERLAELPRLGIYTSPAPLLLSPLSHTLRCISSKTLRQGLHGCCAFPNCKDLVVMSVREDRC
jgi:hypothetical protein